MTTSIYHQSIKRLAADEIGAGTLPAADEVITMDNPLCGDRITLQLIMQQNHIGQVAYQVRGCMLCKAAASIIGAAAKGCSGQEICGIHEQLVAMLHDEAPGNWPPGWAALSFFEPVQNHRSRHGCVLLPFKALLKVMGYGHA